LMPVIIRDLLAELEAITPAPMMKSRAPAGISAGKGEAGCRAGRKPEQTPSEPAIISAGAPSDPGEFFRAGNESRRPEWQGR
jgi:hypothetical protein